MSEQDLHEIENLRHYKAMLRRHRDAPTTEEVIITEEDLERKYTTLQSRLTAAEQRAEQAEAKLESAEFWNHWVYPDGATPEQIQNELFDYRTYLLETAKVYEHITCGKFSKQNTTAAAVIGVYDDEVTSLTERAEKAEAAAAKLAKDALLRLMEDFSEDAYCAGWMMGTENACMDIVSGKIDGWGMVSAGRYSRYREKLTELHDLCGGWWVWSDEKAEPIFKLDAEIEVLQ